MPVVRVCANCKKGFLMSTYQLIRHVEKCRAASGKKDHIVTVKGKKIKVVAIQK